MWGDEDEATMWGDEEEYAESGLPAGTDTPLSDDEYLALVISNEISFITYWDTMAGENDDDFYRRLGQALLEHCASSEVRALQLTTNSLLTKTDPDSSRSLLDAPAVVYPILEYISRTTSLKRLYCDPNPFLYHDDLPDDAEEISKAILANQSISELEMRSDGPHTLMWGIFSRLASRPFSRPPLEKLTIRAVVSGEELLAGNSGFSSLYKSLPKGKKKLKQLKLVDTTVDDSLCKFLLDSNYGRAEHVELTKSEFDLEACKRFATLMEKPPTINKHNKRKNGVDVSIMLDLEQDRHVTPVPGTFLIPSTGRIRLLALGIEMHVLRYAPLLAYRLPQLQYMKKLYARFSPNMALLPAGFYEVVPLEFQHNDPALLRQQMLKGIRRNGSLHYLEIRLNEDYRGWRQFFSSEDDKRKVQAYLDRKKQLPELLSKPRLEHNENEQSTTDLELYPPLFCAASNADSMAPTNVLIGLIATSN